MGNGQSAAFNRISKVIPQIHEQAWEDSKWPDKQRDRDQFIYAIISLISNNGRTSLEETEFKLLFSRTQEDRFVATLVAIKEGVILAKIEPPLPGETKNEAFALFKKHVEMNLHGLLETVPDVAAASSSRGGGGIVMMQGPESSARSSLTTLRTSDLPPAYGEGEAPSQAKPL